MSTSGKTEPVEASFETFPIVMAGVWCIVRGAPLPRRSLDVSGAARASFSQRGECALRIRGAAMAPLDEPSFSGTFTQPQDLAPSVVTQ